jgi:glutamine synthetase adenylyltransferase
MNAIPDHQTLLAENRIQWQKVADYLESKQVPTEAIEKIERLAIASPYALQQLQRYPEWIDPLPRLESFSLEPEIMDVEAQDKIDLQHLKKQLRLYRHQKMIEIIYLDVVAAISRCGRGYPGRDDSTSFERPGRSVNPNGPESLSATTIRKTWSTPGI